MKVKYKFPGMSGEGGVSSRSRWVGHSRCGSDLKIKTKTPTSCCTLSLCWGSDRRRPLLAWCLFLCAFLHPWGGRVRDTPKFFFFPPSAYLSIDASISHLWDIQWRAAYDLIPMVSLNSLIRLSGHVNKITISLICFCRCCTHSHLYQC